MDQVARLREATPAGLSARCSKGLAGAHRLRPEARELVKSLLLLGIWLLPLSAAHSRPAAIHCPGDNTVEMRYCASQSWEQSDKQLRRKISRELFSQWQDATRAVCAKAYAPYKDGTIYPQLVVGCDDHLNRALLKEFRGLGDS